METLTIKEPPCPECGQHYIRKDDPVYKAVERILDEHSAWIARPNDAVTKAIALAATVAAQRIIEESAIGKTRHYSWIGDDHPPGWRCVGSIDVADPADTASARDRGYRIGAIYNGGSYSEAEPCTADIYDEVASVHDAVILANQIERLANYPEAKTPSDAYRHSARLIKMKIGKVAS